MDLTNSVALVTGANRGLGRAFAAQLLERGAKVYAGARNPATVDLPGGTLSAEATRDLFRHGRPGLIGSHAG